ncbi:MAG: hypothetical protein M3459_02365 [Actinomycetota bacterium]|nr:hypothetical protein [Actinomycetota bacterium]
MRDEIYTEVVQVPAWHTVAGEHVIDVLGVDALDLAGLVEDQPAVLGRALNDLVDVDVIAVELRQRRANGVRTAVVGLTLREIYPDVVDGLEEEGGVPSRLLKTDAGDGRQEGTPWEMFAALTEVAPSRARFRWMILRGKVLVA